MIRLFREKLRPILAPTAMALALIFAAFPARAVQPDDLIGLWEASFKVGRAPRERTVEVQIDVWKLDGELCGYYSASYFPLEISEIKLDGKRWSFEAINPVSKIVANRVTGDVILIEGSGDRTFKAEIVGAENEDKETVEFRWREHPKEPSAATDADLSGLYEGKLVRYGMAIKQFQNLKAKIRLDLKEDKVSASVAVDAKLAEAGPNQSEVAEIRRYQNRLFMAWTDAEGNLGRFLGSAGKNKLEGFFFSNRGFGFGVFDKADESQEEGQ